MWSMTQSPFTRMWDRGASLGQVLEYLRGMMRWEWILLRRWRRSLTSISVRFSVWRTWGAYLRVVGVVRGWTCRTWWCHERRFGDCWEGSGQIRRLEWTGYPQGFCCTSLMRSWLRFACCLKSRWEKGGYLRTGGGLMFTDLQGGRQRKG